MSARKRAEKAAIIAALIEMGACSQAVKFARKHGTWAEMWFACEISGWLEWIITEQIYACPGTEKEREAAYASLCKVIEEAWDQSRNDPESDRNQVRCDYIRSRYELSDSPAEIMEY